MSTRNITQPMKDRAFGCFYGQCIGDSLGATFEFNSSKDATLKIDKIIAENKENNSLDQIQCLLPFIGQGTHSLGKGRITDDTEMALALARSLGINKKNSAADLYQKWYRSKPFDIGATTAGALRNQQPNEVSLSNGCLMRCSPLGIFLANKEFDENSKKIITDDVKQTHSHGIAIDAVVSYVKCLQVLIESGDKNLALEAAKSEAQYEIVHSWIQQAEKGDKFPVRLSGIHDENLLKKSAPSSLLANSKQIQPNQNELNSKSSNRPINIQYQTSADDEHMGYIGLAYQLAFYELLNGSSFETSIIDTLKLGGDTDTNGCIVGALIGAYYGSENITNDWKKWILNPEMTKFGKPSKRLEFYPEGDTKDLKFVVEKLLE